jgi:hypothetical protein
MKLKSLCANQPSFHPIIFTEGLNIIVGKQASPHKENDGNTYNGVGKSFVLHLIHFCLGSNKIDSLAKNLPDWEFTLTFEVDGNEYFATRSTNKQDKIDFCGEEINLKLMKKKMLELCFEISSPPKYMTWNTLFSRFVRRYRMSYFRFDTYVPKETDYSKLLNTLFLLGIDTTLILEKKELRDKQKSTKATENAIKNDPFFKQYYLGENDAELDLAELEYRINELENQISGFKISSNYHDLEKEANDKSYKRKMLENKRVLISNYIKNIEDSFKETARANEEDVVKIYEFANVEIPEMIKRNIEEVLEFHRKQVLSRTLRLKKELRKQQIALNEIDKKISIVGERMDELLGYLNSHGALEEYVAITKQLSDLKSQKNRIHEYQKIIKSYKDIELEIKASFINQDKETDEYLENIKSVIDNLKAVFREYAKQFYPQKRSGLLIKNNSGENTLRYTLDARIEDDSSDGVNEVRLFCFDLLLLMCRKSKIRFLAHDSRLFANMDPRQREMLFRIIYDVTQNGEFQYICSINEDTIVSFKELMSEEEYSKIVTNNIVLELNDDAAESKLLGIQVDLDLEDKIKSGDGIK